MRIWTLDEQVEMRRLYPRSSDEELAERFETTAEEIRREAGSLALSKSKAVFSGLPMPRWTPEELDRLTELYPEHSNREIGRLLGRSESSVSRKGARMGLAKTELRRAVAGAENVRLRRTSPPKREAL